MRFVNGILVLTSLAIGGIAGCKDSSSPEDKPHVDMYDACDSASFNATLGAGACVHRGAVTLSQFNAELNANQKVASWRFAPTSLTIHVGDTISAQNLGGERHTFTEVATFGGGVVPSLNTASGNTEEAPECRALADDDFVAPGATYKADPATATGTERYQCCIHPWMRTVVTVASR